jgi:hypothetical protein
MCYTGYNESCVNKLYINELCINTNLILKDKFNSSYFCVDGWPEMWQLW